MRQMQDLTTQLKPLVFLFCALVMASVPGTSFADSGPTLLPKVGVSIPTPGTLTSECTGLGCSYGPFDEDAEFDGKGANVALGVDLLIGLDETVHVGAGLGVVPGLEGEFPASEGLPAEPFELGTAFTLHGILEGRFAVNESLAIPVRGQLGMLFLKPAEEIKSQLDGIEAACGRADSLPGASCSYSGPLGMQLGGGVGVAYDLGAVVLRFDFMYTYDWLRLAKAKTEGSSDIQATAKTINKWGRASFLLGVEL